MSLVGVAYLKFYKLTGEERYLQAARGIAATLAAHIQPGDDNKSPLPFRVNMKTGEVVDAYTAAMVSPVMLFDEMLRLGESGDGKYLAARDHLWQWILDHPVKNNKWSGYYEDVVPSISNLNQQIPMETARFMLRRPEMDPDYKRHVPELLAWVKDRFGKTKHHGATSIKEQDTCFLEMCSHTARYASVNAKWYGLTQDPAYREEARAAFALSVYSVYSKYSKDQCAINYVGITYTNPWFVDSYFDFLCHLQDGIRELPDMAPADADHVIGSDSIIRKINYQAGRIAYTTFEPQGGEILRLSFKPGSITGDAKELAAGAWTYGDYQGASGVLRIHRDAARSIVISANSK